MLDNNEENFSVRKIPVTADKSVLKENSNETDKIKIIELCNIIDKWEEELLFSEKGFFSLQGKEVENKSLEFLEELNRFINSKIDKMRFIKTSSKEIAVDIKNKKIKAIQKQMEDYESQQLKNWEIQVYEDSIKSCIKRAVLYKTNSEIISSSYKNAIAVLDFIAQKEKWNNKTLSGRKNQFESEFYGAIIDSFVRDKDINAFVFFNQYKAKLNIEDKDKIEKMLETLNNSIIAYNWVQELLSYNLSDEENEKEINSVREKEIKPIIKEYMNLYKQEKKQAEKSEQDSDNENNWQEILSILENEPDKAFLYINYSLSEESQNAKKSYIKNFRKNGYIKTDYKKFIELIKDFNKDIDEFKKKSISDLRAVLSKEDYEIIEGLKEVKPDDYCFFISDYDYVCNNLDEEIFDSEENLYNLIKMLFVLRKNYVKTEKKEPDIELRNKIISTALMRFKKTKKSEKNKEGEW